MSLLKTIAVALLIGFCGNPAFPQPSDKDFAIRLNLLSTPLSDVSYWPYALNLASFTT